MRVMFCIPAKKIIYSLLGCGGVDCSMSPASGQTVGAHLPSELQPMLTHTLRNSRNRNFESFKRNLPADVMLT